MSNSDTTITTTSTPTIIITTTAVQHASMHPIAAKVKKGKTLKLKRAFSVNLVG